MTAGASGKRGAIGFDDRVVGFLDAVPALVAVHREIPAAHGRDFHRRRQRGEEPLDVLGRGLRRRIAAIGERMQAHRHAGIGEDFGERRGVVLMRMHAAGRDQAEQMAGAAALL